MRCLNARAGDDVRICQSYVDDGHNGYSVQTSVGRRRRRPGVSDDERVAVLEQQVFVGGGHELIRRRIGARLRSPMRPVRLSCGVAQVRNGGLPIADLVSRPSRTAEGPRIERRHPRDRPRGIDRRSRGVLRHQDAPVIAARWRTPFPVGARIRRCDRCDPTSAVSKA